jgi:putative CocE/NonD family hydrolase
MNLWRVALLCVAGASSASAQQLPFSSAAVGSDTAGVMSALAGRAIAIYKDDNRARYLDNLFRLQMAAGRYTDATTTLRSLRKLEPTGDSRQAGATLLLYSIYARANASHSGVSFDSAFRQTFREVLTPLDDKTSWLLERPLFVYLPAIEQTFDSALQQQKDKPAISLADALKLTRAYETYQLIARSSPLATAMVDDDNRRRYIVETDIPVKTPDGATICTTIIRPRATRGRLPALLTFTIYAQPAPLFLEARRAASRGYAGVVGYTRGKGCSPDTPMPYEYDGADAAALIDWISAQPWSDGRVGMWGGSYSGFTQWAAAKHMPKALKALMPQASAAPAIDVPMDGNLFLSFVYPWPFYTTDVKGLDDSTYNDRARWNKLNHDWYVSGRAYRDLDKIDGKPNPIFHKWIAHPTYDAYWQSMIPYENDFARINIPVLQTAGYYYGGPGAAVYYLTQHYKYNPGAQHYLVIGPYDHLEAQRGMVNTVDTTYALNGYTLDPVALFDMGELRYQWFDYIFKGAPRPALLRDKINYQVMGANVWKHAPSIAAMSDRTLRYYLMPLRVGEAYRLSEGNPATRTSVRQNVDLADRTDADRQSPGGGVLDTAIDTWNGVEFVSNPLRAPTELSGLFSGRLEFRTNKKDFDFQISLYELTSANKYVLLSTYWTRASAVADLTHPRLLTPGARESLDFKSVRLTSRLLQPGSRIVVLINVLKEPDMQINYGTGGDVSDETIADAKEPLTIDWLGDSYIDLPIRD